MTQTDRSTPLSRSWRDIPQQVKPRSMSDEGRRRLVVSVLKTACIIGVLGFVAWGGLTVVRIIQDGPRKVPGQADAAPVKSIVLVTDGVLDREWIVRTLALPKNATLMGLDLYKLKLQVMASGQVQSASLTRNFPSTLTVNLSERMPVARIMAQAGAGEPRMFLVARDGVVFDGVGYDMGNTAFLQWLDGVKLARQGESFLPIASMEKVADLLAKARLEAEHLYRTWQVVSLARLESDGEIEVRTQDGSRIIFGTQEGFFPQLARLDTLLDTARAQTTAPLREINLAIGAHVPVSFDGLASPSVASARSPAAKPSEKSPPLPILIKLQPNQNL